MLESLFHREEKVGKKSLHTDHVAPESTKEKNRRKQWGDYPGQDVYYRHTPMAEPNFRIGECSCGRRFKYPSKGIIRKIERIKCETCREVVLKMEDLCE